jgi:hypothetical protein
MVSAEDGGRMTNRRELLVAVLISFAAPFTLAIPEKPGPLEVTYYFLPG